VLELVLNLMKCFRLFSPLVRPGMGASRVCCLGAVLLLSGLPVSAEMIHRWSFSETSGTAVLDDIGNAHGQIVALAGGGGFQRDGRRVRLDGGARASADYVALPGSVFDGLTEVSIELWAVPHSFPSWGRVFDLGPGEGADLNGNLLRHAFSHGGNGDAQRYGLFGLAPVDAFQPTPVDREYHYVVTWSAAGLLSIYRDGQLQGTQDTGDVTISTLAALPNTTFWLGRSHFGVDATANASYNEVRIYNSVLSPATVAANAARGAEDTLGLVHRWSFSETAGASFADSMGTAPGVIVSPDGVADHSLGNGQVTLAGGARTTADFVQFPPRRLTGFTDLTLELWATPNAARNWSRVIDIGDGLTTTPEDSFLLSFSRGGDLNSQRLEFQPAGTAATAVDSQLATQTGTEYHYVITWDSAAERVNWYRDGEYVNGFDTAGTPLSAVQDEVIWLGRSHWAGDETASASWNELRIYNRALSIEEIQLHTTQGPDVITVPPAVALDDAATIQPGGAVAVEVLLNDTAWRLDPNTLTITTPPAAGVAEVKPNGRVFYQNTSPATADAFRYRVTDTLTGGPVEADVHITITADLRLAATTLRLPPEPPAVGYQTVDAFPGLTFTDPLGVRRSPASNQQLYVIERRGFVQRIPDVTAATPQKEQFLDISDRVSFDNTNLGEMGLQSIALHPDFASNGRLFAYYTAPRPGGRYFNRLSRFEVTRDGLGDFDPLTAVANPASEIILFELYDHEFNHNGGDLHFGPDGYLYVSMGDEGGQRDPLNNSQTITHELYSGILRIDVDKRPGNLEPNPLANPDPGSRIPLDGGVARYSIPADNPFVGATSFNGVAVDPADVRTEFWAVGFRHPWRMGFDDETGELWVGDVGQYDREEVNLVAKGFNYGWKYREGTVATPGVGTPPAGWTAFNPVDPVWEYLHNGPAGFNGFSVTGGRVYRGEVLPAELRGAYIFSDFVTGHIWALTRDANATNVVRIAGDDGIAAFGTDPSNGDILLCDYVENRIKRLVHTDATDDDFPQWLSETGAFADTETLTPNPGVVTYEPNVAFWSDHAVKRRWFALPDLDSRFGFQAHGNWSLPTDAVWIKHFDLELERGNPATRRRLETRFIVKNEAGVYGVSYQWNEAQTDAALVGSAGTVFDLEVIEEGTPFTQTWEIPSRSACLTCHTEVGGRALSFNTAQLNREGPLGGGGNQLLRLSEAGYLHETVASVIGLPAHVPAGNDAVSLESRVRSYLEVNCVSCHQPGGAGTSTWDARAFLRLDQTGLLNGLPQNNGGDPENRLVAAGDLAHSVLLQRIRAGNGFTRMPPLATRVLDQEAIDLLTAWITLELPTRKTYAQWQLAEFGSTEIPEAAKEFDDDLDGLSNYYEFLTGTPPRVANPPWTISITDDMDSVSIEFGRQPHRGYLVQSSEDLLNWEFWDVPDNRLWFGAAAELERISGPAPAPGSNRFFRLQIIEP
jgi:glucose/arabinose dehydrogenase